MSTPGSFPTPVNLEQQRTLAKELLRAARAGDVQARARIEAVRSDAGTASRPLRLSDAQLALARENGFDSWPKLVAALEAQDMAAFGRALQAGDMAGARRLLALQHVSTRLDAPVFDFGQRALHLAAKHEPLVTMLLDAGADPNLESEWKNGPFTVLDHAGDHTARVLIARGATLTPNVAARLGWKKELLTLLDADPSVVHSRGGDGRQPLHEAGTPEIADLLLNRGAAIDARCIDHRSTPAQYALVDRPDVCRRLLERGATPDIFMAARLGDAALAARLLKQDPACVDARINAPGYEPVPPLTIYCWTLGFDASPYEIAMRFGHRDVHELLAAGSPMATRLMTAILAADEPAARRLIDADPPVLRNLIDKASDHLARAIFHERFDTAELMLGLGFDPSAPGVDGGSALHAACWVGNVTMVNQLLVRDASSLNVADPTYGSTPLGWAAFGSVHRRAAGANYPAVIETLVEAGASVRVAGNGSGRSLVSMAHGNPAVQSTLRRLGAS